MSDGHDQGGADSHTRYRNALRRIIQSGTVGVRTWVDGVPGDLIDAPPGPRDELPSVVLYRRTHLAVHRDFVDEFTAASGSDVIEIGDGDPEFGWSETYVLVDVGDRDAHDVLRAHFPDDMPTLPGDVDEDVDVVSLIHFYWTASHVFFWPFAGPTPTDPGEASPAAEPGPERDVYVLDTGTHADHPYFGGMASLVKGAQDGETNGHGTSVAGIVRRHNANARIHAANVAHSLGDIADEAVVAARINSLDISEAQFPVLNLSLGGPHVGNINVLGSALKRFKNRGGKHIVAAAGNVHEPSERRKIWPAAWDFVVAVGSKDPNDKVHDWSNNHPENHVDDWVDMYANGADVVAPIRGNAFARWSGTSFSAPQIAATIT
jgi:hypothetical protein